MKLKQILAESVIAEISIGARARQKQQERPAVDTQTKLNNIANRLIQNAKEYNKSYEDTARNFLTRCKILQKKNPRINKEGCMYTFNRLWKGTMGQTPDNRDDSPAHTHSPGASRT